MKINYLTLTCMLGLGANFALAQDTVKEKAAAPAKVVDVGQEEKLKASYDEIHGKITKVNNEFMAKLRAEKDRNKQREMYQNMRPDNKADMEELLVLANANPASDHTLNILLWGQRSFNPEQKAVANKILMENHVNKDQFADVVSMLSRSRNEPNATFEKIKAVSNNPKVRQAAAYALAERYLSNKDTKAEGIALFKQLVAIPDIDQTNPRLAKGAQGKIFVAEKLSIGATAPDIIGTDHANAEFKLSDYRGKVVVVDFWGYW